MSMLYKSKTIKDPFHIPQLDSNPKQSSSFVSNKERFKSKIQMSPGPGSYECRCKSFLIQLITSKYPNIKCSKIAMIPVRLRNNTNGFMVVIVHPTCRMVMFLQDLVPTKSAKLLIIKKENGASLIGLPRERNPFWWVQDLMKILSKISQQQ